MRLFLSHSSRQKPLVRELLHYLPDFMLPWLDEKQLLVGDAVTTSLKTAIQADSDLVILFVDRDAARSEWVSKELSWALEREKVLGRPFILPIVLDPAAWDQLEPAVFRDRKHLDCKDFEAESIRNLATSLTSQVFQMMVRIISAPAPAAAARDSLALVDDADQILMGISSDIHRFLRPYQRQNPLPITDLFARLRERDDLRSYVDDQLVRLLGRLRKRGLLAGLVVEGRHIFVAEEHMTWKTKVFQAEKLRIARVAASMVPVGATIALDAGSTTLEVVRQLIQSIRMEELTGITIVTNSLSHANEVMAAASEMGLEDGNPLIRLFVAGGRVKPSTMAIVDELAHDSTAPSHLAALLTKLGGADLAFVGTNGVAWPDGFTTEDPRHADLKHVLLTHARRPIILTDPSKFGVRQGAVFARFSDPIELVTVPDQANAVYAEYIERLAGTAVKVLLA
jgi:DeoR/GlpR family transcriptional regulator of sugar metabolism